MDDYNMVVEEYARKPINETKYDRTVQQLENLRTH